MNPFIISLVLMLAFVGYVIFKVYAKPPRRRQGYLDHHRRKL